MIFLIGISDEYPSSLIDEKQSSSSILSSVANIFKNFVGNISQNNEQIIGNLKNIYHFNYLMLFILF